MHWMVKVKSTSLYQIARNLNNEHVTAYCFESRIISFNVTEEKKARGRRIERNLTHQPRIRNELSAHMRALPGVIIMSLNVL